MENETEREQKGSFEDLIDKATDRTVRLGKPTPYSLLELFRKGTAALEAIWTGAPGDYDRVVVIASTAKIAIDHWLTEAEQLAEGSKEASPIYQAFRGGSLAERHSILFLLEAAASLLERIKDETATLIMQGCIAAIEGEDPPPLSDDRFRWINRFRGIVENASTEPEPAPAADPEPTPDEPHPTCSSVGCPNVAPPAAGHAGMCPACWEAVEKLPGHVPLAPNPQPALYSNLAAKPDAAAAVALPLPVDCATPDCTGDALPLPDHGGLCLECLAREVEKT